MPTGIYKRTEEHKAKLRVPHNGSGIYLRTDVHRKIISDSGKGRVLTIDHKKKISDSMTGEKNHFFGKKHPDKNRLKMSQSHKGKIPWNKNIKYSKEMCEKFKKSSPRGEKSYRWIKDRNKIKKNERKHEDSEYKRWALNVKNRDNWKCKIQNPKCNGRLEAHHILPWRDYPELRYDINNGIALCQAHHPRRRVEETKLSPYFKELMTGENKALSMLDGVFGNLSKKQPQSQEILNNNQMETM